MAGRLRIEVIAGVPFVADVPEKSLGDSGSASGAAASVHGDSGPKPTATYSERFYPGIARVNLR